MTSKSRQLKQAVFSILLTKPKTKIPIFHKLIFRGKLKGTSKRLQRELSFPFPWKEGTFTAVQQNLSENRFLLPNTTAIKCSGCSDSAFNQVTKQYLEYLCFIELVQSSFFLRKLFDFICKLFYFFVCISQSPLQALLFLSEVKRLLLPAHVFHHHRLLLVPSFLTLLVCLEKHQNTMNQTLIS